MPRDHDRPRRMDGYIRVSRRMGREGPGYISPDVQRESIQRWAGYRGVEIAAWHSSNSPKPFALTTGMLGDGYKWVTVEGTGVLAVHKALTEHPPVTPRDALKPGAVGDRACTST